MTAIIITLLLAGIIAGLIQYFVIFKELKVEQEAAVTSNLRQNVLPGWLEQIYTFLKNHWQFFAYIIVGIGGAFLVPVINELTNGSLPGLDIIKKYTECLKLHTGDISEAKKCQFDPWYFIVLFGYGIILGYSTLRIIKSVSTLLIGNLTKSQEELKKKQEEADQNVQMLTATIEELKAKLPKDGAVPPATNLAALQISAEDYFNEAQNQADKQIYYAGVNLSDTQNLFKILNQLITNTHTAKLNYKPSQNLYPVVDRYEDGLLRSIYSGKPINLQTILNLDEQVDRARNEAIAALNASYLSVADFDSAAEEIIAGLPYNCEHVVPQAWFGKKEPMRGDLHHLFTCEESCNNFRKDYKYYDFNDYGDNVLNAVKHECGKLENELFEPEINKGMAARAVLYFLLRYPGSFVKGGYGDKGIELLIKWHNSYKVSRYELHRNYCIYKMQGNRNPLIDYPELADKIGFTPTAVISLHEADVNITPNGGDDDTAAKDAADNLTTGDHPFEAALLQACTTNPTAKPWNNWRPAESLKVLLKQINVLAPTRKKASDGMIGDLAHQSTNSDHNPWVWDATAQKGIVTALDITHDPDRKCDCSILAASLQTNKDARIKYVIWNSQIMNSSSINGSAPWAWRAYNGANPHNKHIHISVKCENESCDSVNDWAIRIS